MVSTISELLALQSLCMDWNLSMRLNLNTDATAAMGMAARRGLGKAKHIATCFLWIQEKIASERIHVQKKGTQEQLADCLTKFLPRDHLERLLIGMGFEFASQSHSLRLRA